MKIDPLKCSLRCLREENPPITEATGRQEPLHTPVATDGGLRDYISVTITND